MIEFRISGDEFIEGGMTVADSSIYAKLLEKHIDLLHVSGAGLSTASHDPKEKNDPSKI